MSSLLRRLIGGIVKTGNLKLIMPSGTTLDFGDGSGKEIIVRVHDRLLAYKLLYNPDLAIGNGYMNGGYSIERGSIYDLLHLFMSQFDFDKVPAWRMFMKVRKAIQMVERLNTVGRSQRNVAHHYDLSGELYDLFLDSDRQYSCAYFETEDQSLERAQLAKKRHIAAKLAIQPGQRVLDIGCGWGGLAIYLAEVYDVHVTGVTLSVEQHDLARRRVEERGLHDKIDIRLQDYRDLREKFDRVVSVGMFEHVGRRYFNTYFSQIQKLLSDDGVALVHSIGRQHGPSTTSPWIKRNIFPGGYLPAMSEVTKAVEQSGLCLTDAEFLRLHYAQTLSHWSKRFAGNRDKAKRLYDERFCRMWEYYLAVSELAFRVEFCNVFQIQLARHQQALPITRDYMHKEEQRLRQIENSRLIKSLKSVPQDSGA